MFLAAKKVAPDGVAIGVDRNPVTLLTPCSKDHIELRITISNSFFEPQEMLRLAQSNASKSSLTNVSFVESAITSISLPSASANCIVSNCVINLVPEPEKILVFREIFRLLKPGGRLAISDILAYGPLEDEIKRNMALYVGCIAGASTVEQYESYLSEAGFQGELQTGPFIGPQISLDDIVDCVTQMSLLSMRRPI